MSDLLDIFRRNNATFRDFATGEHVGRRKQVAAFVLIGAVIALLCNRPSNDFLAGALSALAILVGFSFNVLFYLVANRLARPKDFASIEHRIKFERLIVLSDEVFDSTAYFAIVATGAIISSLLLLLANSDVFTDNLRWVLRSEVAGYHLYHATRRLIVYVPTLFLSFALYVSIVESLYTFIRTVQRVRFYFTMLRSIPS